MPNIGALLKQEIVRLSRRELRAQTMTTRKASAQQREHIAALKRQVTTLERQVAQLQRRVPAPAPAAPAAAGERKARFSPKGLKAHRERIGFSAADYGRLVGVSAQSIYNWEQGHASPRAGQLTTMATLRGIGKRAAQERLDQATASEAPAARKR